MKKLKILSIDGGGTRGVIPATILDLIYQDTNLHPAEIFDLLAGTSTGGILCTGYSYGISTSQMLSLYLKKASDIFYDSGWDDIRDGFGKNLGADYSNRNLKKILKETFGDDTLANIREREPNGKGRLMVCSFDLNPQEFNPKTNKRDLPVNFRPRVYHSDFLRDQNVKLVDLCLMTSAGPTYFPIYNNHIDGGVTLNNPSMAALAYAINKGKDDIGEYRHPEGIKKGLEYDKDNIQLLSLGCGTSNKNFIAESIIKNKDNGDWGNLQWVKYLPDMLTETNMQATDYYMAQLLNSDQYKRIQLFFDSEDAPKTIRGKSLSLDVKRQDLLEAMVDYATKVYNDKKDEIFHLIGLNELQN